MITLSGAVAYWKEHARYLAQPNSYLNIDCLRAMAVMMVVITHFANTCYKNIPLLGYLNLMTMGTQGVDLFFVLSGFLISGMLLKQLRTTESIDFKKFYYHRFLRIYPVYFAATFATFALVVIRMGISNAPWKAVFIGLLQNAFFLQTTLQAGPTDWQALGSWSLCVEEWFYWIVPLLMLATFKLTKKAKPALPFLIAGYLVLAVMLRVVTICGATKDLNSFDAWIAGAKPWCHFDALLIGIIAQLVHKQIPSRLLPSIALTALGCALVGKPYWQNWSLVHGASLNMPFWHNCLGAPAFTAAGFGLLLLGTMPLKLKTLPVTVLAKLSFPLYLFHCLVVKFFPYLGVKTALPLLIGESFALTYFVSLAIEYPFLRMYRGKPAAAKGPALLPATAFGVAAESPEKQMASVP